MLAARLLQLFTTNMKFLCQQDPVFWTHAAWLCCVTLWLCGEIRTSVARWFNSRLPNHWHLHLLWNITCKSLNNNIQPFNHNSSYWDCRKRCIQVWPIRFDCAQPHLHLHQCESLLIQIRSHVDGRCPKLILVSWLVRLLMSSICIIRNI